MSEIRAAEGDNWLAGVVATLRTRWWVMAGAVLIALIAAMLYLRGATYYYTAELKVYAAPSSSGQPQMSSALGGLAALATGSATSEAASPFRLYVEGVRTREVAERLARDRDLMHAVFVLDWDARARQWRERRGIGGTIKRAVWSLFGVPIQPWRAPDAASLQDYIGKRVTVIVSPKSPLVSISIEHPDPVFAKRFLTRLGETVDSYLREQQQARLRGNIDYLSEKLRGVTLIEQRQALFDALAEQERQAMLANSRAPYAANPFGVAVATSQPTTPRQIPLLIGWMLAGLFAGAGGALLLGPRRPPPFAGA